MAIPIEVGEGNAMSGRRGLRSRSKGNDPFERVRVVVVQNPGGIHVVGNDEVRTAIPIEVAAGDGEDPAFADQTALGTEDLLIPVAAARRRRDAK